MTTSLSENMLKLWFIIGKLCGYRLTCTIIYIVFPPDSTSASALPFVFAPEPASMLAKIAAISGSE
jgi:hypothetical protein